jgi:hypothetical protein
MLPVAASLSIRAALADQYSTYVFFRAVITPTHDPVRLENQR